MADTATDPVREMTGIDLDKAVADHVLGLDVANLVSMPVSCPDGIAACGVYHCAPHWPNGVRFPSYSSDFATAWAAIIPKVKSWLFSRRQLFLKELQLQSALPSGELVAWPDLLLYLNATMICRAAVIAARADL